MMVPFRELKAGEDWSDETSQLDHEKTKTYDFESTTWLHWRPLVTICISEGNSADEMVQPG